MRNVSNKERLRGELLNRVGEWRMENRIGLEMVSWDGFGTIIYLGKVFKGGEIEVFRFCFCQNEVKDFLFMVYIPSRQPSLLAE